MRLLNNKEPLYVQVKDILKDRIISGQYPINTLMPSEQELRKEFDVSIITIRKAVEQLANQGYVEKRSGIGTTVLDNNAVSTLSKGQRFSEYLIESGYNLEKSFVSLKKKDSADFPFLAEHFTGSCYCMERLYILDGKPYVHFRHYVPGDVDVPEDMDHFQSSLYEIMYQQGFNFQSFKDEFGVAVPDEDVAHKLEVEQQPLLQRLRYSFDPYDRLIEYSVAFYNTNLHKYIVKLDV